MNLSLYVLTVLIWGTTWIALKLQLGVVAIPVSIVYRFGLAALVLFALLLLLQAVVDRSDFDDFRILRAFAAFGAGILGIGRAAPIGAEIVFGPNEGTRGEHDAQDSLVQRFRGDRLREKFGDPGIARFDHAALFGMAGEHDDRHEAGDWRIRAADGFRELDAVIERHGPVGDDDVGLQRGESFETGGAVFSFEDFAGAETMQKLADDAPHMGVIVDDQKFQSVEVDPDHGAPGSGAFKGLGRGAERGYRAN